MGTFKEPITLANARDIGNARNGVIPEAKIRRITVDAIPDTGAWTLVINEKTREKLGLAIVKMVKSSLADGSTTEYGLSEPVEIRWKDRHVPCDACVLSASVLPGGEDVLLGKYPLVGMDLTVNTETKEVVGAHGDKMHIRI
jgi:hypothetical protein